MITQKKITELFEVKRGTLTAWKKTKPKLYTYLESYDGKDDKFRKVNILLENYIKTASINSFTIDEIEFILNLNITFADTFEAEDIALQFINTTQKAKIKNTTFTLEIIQKLSSLNLIEKYIFCERLENIHKMLKPRSDEKTDLINHYFSEFLEVK